MVFVGASAQPDNSVWKIIWGLSVQSKVRNFLWRSCHNAIPVKQNLRQRHILTEDICELCKLETESVLHALWVWGCSQLSQVWGSVPSFSFRQTRTFSSIKEFLTYTNEEQKNPEFLASIMWTLWHRRFSTGQFRCLYTGLATIVSKPEIKRLHLTSDCQFLIMASDGLWGIRYYTYVNDQEAVDVVLRDKNLLMSCKKLVDMFSSRGSMDDITVMVIDLLNFVATGC
ncbi:putative protein phosphatase 2c 53 [Quercus suber]|uniref:PPM-type phosphatase domain-containing protein n=1 Tax=Quercus suber TaxID=58331 RepID=A0AAW0KCJ1_QUESU